MYKMDCCFLRHFVCVLLIVAAGSRGGANWACGCGNVLVGVEKRVFLIKKFDKLVAVGEATFVKVDIVS